MMILSEIKSKRVPLETLAPLSHSMSSSAPNMFVQMGHGLHRLAHSLVKFVFDRSICMCVLCICDCERVDVISVIL